MVSAIFIGSNGFSEGSKSSLSLPISSSPPVLRTADKIAEARDQAGHVAHIALILGSELGQSLALLDAGEPRLHEDQHWKHREGKQSRPLQQETEHHHNETDILRMPDIRVDTAGGERLMPLCLVEHLPPSGNQNEPAADKGEAQQVKGAKVRAALPTEHHL
jgi:hypothetical protein